MIVLDSVSKIHGRWNQQTTIIDRLSVVFQPRTHYVILGQPGSGKSTLLRLLCGLQRPSSGTIRRTGTVAPPIGSQGMLLHGKSVRGVIAFCANLYHLDLSEFMQFVLEFAELHDHLDTSIAALPGAERLALSYAIGYGIPADFYLIDGAVAGGSEALRRRCQAAFEERRANAGTIFVSRNSRNVEQYGDHAAILHNGELVTYENMQEALDIYAAMELNSRKGTLSAAEMMVRQGNLPDALTYLEDYVAINSGDPAGHRLLASVALRSQNFAVAKDALQTLIKFEPDDSKAYLALARAAERDEDWETASTTLNLYLELEPEDRTVRTSLARCYERAGHAKTAARIWHRIFADSDGLPEAMVAIRSCIRLDDWNAAFRMVDHAVERWPHDVPLLTLAAQTYLQLERLQDFTDVILRMLEVDLAKAITLASRSQRQLEWRHIVALLNRVRELGLLGEVKPEVIQRFLVQLNHLSRAADADNRAAEAQEIRDHIQSFKVPA